MSEPAIQVRRAVFASARDAAAYLELLDAYARDPMGAGHPLSDAVRRRVATDLADFPGAHCLLAECAGRAVGFATCFVGYSTFQGRRLLNIHDIAVLPAWRGRAVARHLLDEITALAGRLDCCRITLEVREDNARARTLYARAGFRAAACNLFLEKPL